MNMPNRKSHLPKFAIGCVAALILAGCSSEDKVPDKSSESVASSTASDENLTERERVAIVSESENLLQELASEMKQLGGSFCKSDREELPFASKDLKFVGIEATHLTDDGSHKRDHHGLPAKSNYCNIAEKDSSDDLQTLFASLTDNQPLNDMQIGTLSAAFVADDRFAMETKLEGKFTRADGSMVGLKGYQTLTWVKEGDWKLVHWKQKKLKVTQSKMPLFEDVTATAIPDVKTHKAISRSSHQELIRKMVEEATASGGQMGEPREEFKGFADWFSSYQYPSVSVIDIDKDGFDDLFVTDRWQPAQLLRNKGDGTFEDITEKSGLKIDELANCTYFADFDNDGDSDAFVGISMGPSQFFRNNDGKFEPDEINNAVIKDSRFVVAASVVDINNDGLLDLYLSTYAYGFGAMSDWYTRATYPKDQIKMRVRMAKQNQYVDRAGPPNMVLMNRGDKFEWVDVDDTVKQFHDSYQSSWSDIDGDGDLDAYICNDFANDVFLRNDTPQGADAPVLVDATNEFIGDPKLNFAMGASWGDYDRDGDLDLYVSNMYSKAGMRICSQLTNVDERVSVSARGNYLYQNESGKLNQIAGLDKNDQQVAIVGWSFGGQFGDFDNDGHLDLYVPSGFYSPPKELHTDKDL